MEQREQWGSKAGFIIAAISSAVGLGNIWRYPYVVYENGGGAFLIPYFIALLTAAIPILIMEYALGHRSRGSVPRTFQGLSRRFEWIGWWQIFICVVIISYYMAIIGWALSYTYYSIGTQWGNDPESFFFKNFLGMSDSFWNFGGIQWKVLLPVLLAWAALYFVLIKGVKKGIEKSAKILMPILVVFMIIITIRGVTLPGSVEGLNVLLTPKFSALADPKVWIAAYGQVFFSLSIGFGIMMTYSSYLPKKSDLSNSAFIAGLANSGFEFLAALGVFGALGFLAVQQGVGVENVAKAGVGLAFVVFPNIINEFPGLNSLFGVCFFGALLFAGFTSAVSILEPCISAVREKFNLTRKAAVNWVCGITFVLSLLYTTRGGLRYLDTIDRFINSYGIVLAGLAEVIVLAWVLRQLDQIRDHVNGVSIIRIGRWWNFVLAVVTPIILIIMTAFNLVDELKKPYEGYPMSGLIVMGWGVAALVIVFGWIAQSISWKDQAMTTGRDEQ
ncbi:sodium-dependent transporter [Thermoflavimicrobium daqui]|uniref:Sodium-dependent transporter n=1 Tax=Thermoflavimicrobium daqui TaxID=2137476 RepID=A0A364K168_9BACL|nr:sodium-dependent transporter [Thermoflavimicrobium daqui]RAL21440.1 sodium-dependent transporter [Thermoflavimicrobium daqui]